MYESEYTVRIVVEHHNAGNYVLSEIDVLDNLYVVNAKKMSDIMEQNQDSEALSSQHLFSRKISEVMGFVKSNYYDELIQLY